MYAALKYKIQKAFDVVSLAEAALACFACHYGILLDKNYTTNETCKCEGEIRHRRAVWLIKTSAVFNKLIAKQTRKNNN